jgi:hypothetical protein
MSYPKINYYRMAPCPTLYPIRMHRLLVKLKIVNPNRFHPKSTWVTYVIRMYRYQYNKDFHWNGDHFEER